ncbi:MAG: Cadherin domain protein [Planctomycetaceae bacterium]|nr:Cadherin domain protein [Planctomycetaceae bacterium]
MTQRSQLPTDGFEGSLISRLCAAMGLATQPKRAAQRRLIDSSESLETRQMLSATGSNLGHLDYNFPLADQQQPHINVQLAVVDVQDQAFSVAENTSAGAVVGTVVAFDPDTSTPLSYEITAGNTNAAFAINSVTGAVTVANSSALNYEAQTTFSLTVMVTDSTDPTTSDTAVITINVTNVDEPTSISINQTPISYQIGSEPILVDPTALVIPDPDTPSPSYKNARLVIGVAGPRLSTLDVIRVMSQGNGVGQIRVTGTQIYYEGHAIASYKGGRGADPKLTISFYSTATDQSVQALLRQVAFNTKTHTDPAPDRVLNFALINVGGQNAPVVSRVIHITRP